MEVPGRHEDDACLIGLHDSFDEECSPPSDRLMTPSLSCQKVSFIRLDVHDVRFCIFFRREKLFNIWARHNDLWPSLMMMDRLDDSCFTDEISAFACCFLDFVDCSNTNH